jgi:hypothetical protein
MNNNLSISLKVKSPAMAGATTFSIATLNVRLSCDINKNDA